MLLSLLLQTSVEVAQASVEVTESWMKMGAAFAAAIAVIGAAYGISKIGRAAVDSIARQPEAANDLRSSMIVSAALIEGATFFAIVVALLVLFV